MNDATPQPGTAPRITLDDVKEVIVEENFHVFEGSQLTVCCLTMRNGFTVTGESACVSPENFDAELGQKIAREKAMQEVWRLEAYLLKERLALADPGKADQFGWLVEHGPREAPVYLHMQPSGVGWTKDAFKAIRFARREDARQALDMYGPDHGRVAEHAFDG